MARHEVHPARLLCFLAELNTDHVALVLDSLFKKVLCMFTDVHHIGVQTLLLLLCRPCRRYSAALQQPAGEPQDHSRRRRYCNVSWWSSHGVWRKDQCLICMRCCQMRSCRPLRGRWQHRMPVTRACAGSTAPAWSRSRLDDRRGRSLDHSVWQREGVWCRLRIAYITCCCFWCAYFIPNSIGTVSLLYYLQLCCRSAKASRVGSLLYHFSLSIRTSDVIRDPGHEACSLMASPTIVECVAQRRPMQEQHVAAVQLMDSVSERAVRHLMNRHSAKATFTPQACSSTPPHSVFQPSSLRHDDDAYVRELNICALCFEQLEKVIAAICLKDDSSHSLEDD